MADVAMEDEDAYVSSEDEDFDPSTANLDENISASSGDDEEADAVDTIQVGEKPKSKKRRKKDDEAEDLGFENSGDEATIKKGMKRKRKGGDGDDDSGGEGGFVKTRSMRVVEEKEKKRPLATFEGATVDVNVLWKSMNLGETLTIPSAPTSEGPVQKPPVVISNEDQTTSDAPIAVPAPNIHPNVNTTRNYREELITIPFTRTVDSTPTELYKTVLKYSDEAVAYLRKHPNSPPLPRSIPARRISKWDPNPEGTIRGLPSDVMQTGERLILLDVHKGQRLKITSKSHLPDWPPPPNVPTMWEYNWRKPQQVSGVKKWKLVVPKEQKMNVVDKSKMDWEAHVEREGDREELEQAAKAKGAYLDRVDFLGRTEANREEELRAARRK